MSRLAFAVTCLGLVTACPDCLILDPLRIPTDTEVQQRLGAANIVAIDDMALFRGFESDAVYIKGNGCLAATRDGLLFVMWLPKKRVWIPPCVRIVAASSRRDSGGAQA